ncbi:MAG TPA: flagellar biosynthesis protein FlhF [Herbaspirillum sp.]|nr:flagellar biosynthesis protein FlhF [Herbaspirillum sp.]
MNVKKFVAASSREAWRNVRETLGPDAVILSNRTIKGGVEILAMANEEMSTLATPAPARSTMRPSPARKMTSELDEAYAPAMSAAAFVANEALRAKSESAPSAQAFAAKPAAAPAPTHAAPEAASPAAVARVWRNRAGVNSPTQAVALADVMAARRLQAAATENAAAAYSEVMKEIRQMRGALESQLAEISWDHTQKRDPHKADVMREMLAAGFSASLSRLMTEHLPPGGNAAAGLAWVKSILARNLLTMNNENELLEQGGVYALVGPTGVGKTTTTAKLAARCVMRHGANKLALITTDGYRIGGYEQLRIYGKILGVMVHSVKDESDLRIALEELKGKHTVLIDTVGVGQRDQMVAEQVAMLSGAGTEVKRLLCLNATVTGSTLNEVVGAYKGDGLAGCIITKLDEAATIGNVIDIVIRQKLNLYYVANGQRVPEDLHVANKLYLADRAFKQKRETAPFELRDTELPLIAGQATRAVNDKTLREVIIG